MFSCNLFYHSNSITHKTIKLIWMLFFLPFIFIPLNSFSQNISQWQILPQQSELTFTAIQNNAPIEGSFKKFNGEISFAENNLTQSSVHIVVDMLSLTTSYDDLTTTLNNQDWFDIKSFPSAEFKAKQFTKINNKTYKAFGDIRIRDITTPMSFTFTVEKNSGNLVKIKGNGVLRRTVFKVGQGEWLDTKEIKDEVEIQFTITAQKI